VTKFSLKAASVRDTNLSGDTDMKQSNYLMALPTHMLTEKISHDLSALNQSMGSERAARSAPALLFNNKRKASLNYACYQLAPLGSVNMVQVSGFECDRNY